MMNQHAARLGMTNSHLKTVMDSHGGPLHQCTRFSYPDVGFNQRVSRLVSLFSQKEFTFNKITQHNRNQLLSRDESVAALKPDLLMMPVIAWLLLP